MNHGKIPKGLWPLFPYFRKIIMLFFWKTPEKNYIKVQNWQYKFLDWKWPPPLRPFGSFPKIHTFWRFGSPSRSLWWWRWQQQQLQWWRWWRRQWWWWRGWTLSLSTIGISSEEPSHRQWRAPSGNQFGKRCRCHRCYISTSISFY